MKFHYLVRGIFFQNGKVLLAHMKGAGNTFLPGGHVEMGEKAEAALLREIREEIGKEATVKRFIGAVESTYTDTGHENHEINLLFELEVPSLNADQPPASHESHLEFLWARINDLKTHNLLPEPMIDCLKNWENGNYAFWGSDFHGIGGTG